MLKVSIVDIKDGLHELTLTPEPADLDLDPELFRDLRVDLRLDRQRDRVFAMLDVTGRATLECDRTLTLFEQEVEGHHEVLFVPPDDADRAAEGDLDDVRPLLPTDQEIDLTTPVRDTLLLALPQRRIAPGADEMDLETRYGGSDDEIDPRWEALRKLKESTSTEEGATGTDQ